ncbi:MAG TPA: acyl-homoserine-lactone synthase [Sphingomicrobium sp.]|nr:acyl-homoserine-lactone synthase [Sphingomicrobium sp.]
MVVVERGARIFLERPALKGMFEARKQVFVDLLRWDLPVIDDRFEIDQFDGAEATYIVISEPSGEHLGSARLLKTTSPHILGDLFPHLCAGPVPRGQNILEITRFCLGRNQGAARRRQTRNRLVSALVGYALAHQVQLFTGVAEMAWLQQILAFGWDCRPLGIPQQVGKTLTGAISISVTLQTPHLLEANGIWTDEEPCGCALPEAA